MNYDHFYHAGNFADVVKHAIIARIVDYLKRKDKPFRVIDTHAGSGLYDLSSERARKTGEWRTGIAKLTAAQLPSAAAELLKPYLDIVTTYNPGLEPDGDLDFYPGSPVLVKHMLRGRDRLSAIELEPEAAFALKTRFSNDFQVRVIELDGWLALGAHLPPKERRGLVIVDPPYEIDNEFERILEGLQRAHSRWPSGIYAFWYPIKDLELIGRFRTALRTLGVPRILDAVLTIRSPVHFPRLDGSGLILVNPPYTIEDELRIILPALRDALAEDSGASWSLEWLAGEAEPG